MIHHLRYFQHQLTVLAKEDLVVGLGCTRNFRMPKLRHRRKDKLLTRFSRKIGDEMKKEVEFLGSNKDGSKFLTRSNNGDLNIWDGTSCTTRGSLKGPVFCSLPTAFM